MATDAPPFEFLWIVKESAYSTPKTSPTAGVDSIYIRLAGANRFTPRPVPTKRKIQFGGGFQVPGYAVYDQWQITGTLEVELCYSQALLLLSWAGVRINSAQTSPWTTTEPIADLASCACYHATARSDDGSIKRRVYLGTKVHSWKITCNAQSGLAMLSLTLMSQKMQGNTYDSSSDPTSGAFPAPADTAFPTDPVLLLQSTVNVASTALTYVTGFEFTATNAMDPLYFAGSPWIGFDRLRGRESSLSLDLLYTASPDWRTQYEALTSEAVTVVATNSVKTITIDMKSDNLVDTLSDNLSPGKVYMQAVTFQNQYDTTNSADIAITVA